MMLYPNIMNIKKSNFAMKILIGISIVIIFVCVLINELVTPQLKWSFLVVLGIVYVWITTLYSIQKNVNIASHVWVQTIVMLVFLYLIDKIVGYKGWSINIGMPIVIGVTNITMLILTIVSRRKYFKYSFYQMLLSLVSIIVIVLLMLKAKYRIISVSITSGIAIVTLMLSIILCGKDLKEKIYRMFHI